MGVSNAALHAAAKAVVLFWVEKLVQPGSDGSFQKQLSTAIGHNYNSNGGFAANGWRNSYVTVP